MQNNQRKNLKPKTPKQIQQNKAKNLCYLSLYGDKYLDVQRSKFVSFKTFDDYLSLALRAAEAKKKVAASYVIVNRSNDFKLSTWIMIKVTSKIVNGKYISDETKLQALEEVGIPLEEVKVETINVNGISVPFYKYEDSYIFEADKSSRISINSNSEIEFEKEEFKSSLVTYYGNVLPVRKQKVQIEKYIGDECTDINCDIVKYKINKDSEDEKEDEITLELLDDNTTDISIYDVFFSEDAAEVYFNDEKVRYKIVYRNKESGRIVIKTKNGQTDLAGCEKVHLVTNTVKLRRQQNALKFLVNRPSIFQKSLLDLSEQKKFYTFPIFTPSKLNLDYKILTDETREGNDTQRDFVQKSLQTPDFMILQGPPGSGKTTAILELIYQLAKQGKKVLLCASTHVAIDNVLEKIVKHNNKNELLEVINPVRVGDESNVYSEEVKEYIYSNLVENIPDYSKKMVEESFNLVCGTTIGVLSFPLINDLINVATDGKKTEPNDTSTVEPIFDYMILDEASKTTFSEFLVPGVLCKKWIIVGDVKQLAPYVEKDDLIPSLLTCEPLAEKSKRDAILFLMKYRKKDKIKDFGFLLSKSSISYIDSRIGNSDNVIAVTDAKLTNIFTISKYDIINKTYKLNAINTKEMIVLIEDGLEDYILPYVNYKFTLLSPNENLKDPTLFSKYAILHAHNSFDKDYMKNSKDYQRRLEDELLWRLIRLYELSSEQSASKKYSTYIDDVRNVLDENEKVEFDRTIDTLRNIAIPSIIMMLQEGINKLNERASILSSGFSEFDKVNRFLMLDYQHRMHKDISRVPRENVYENKALKDSIRWRSYMNYPGTKTRFEVRNIEGPIIKNNINEAECEAIISELKTFIEYLKYNPKTNGKICTIGILAFYNGQVVELRKKLQQMFNTNAKFNFRNEYVHVALNSVDRFQGQEADVIYLSMVQNDKVGFLDSISRVNVAITRAKEQIIIFGDAKFFKKQQHSEMLNKLFKEVK